MEKEKIKTLLNERDALYETDYTHPKVDEIQKEISDAIKKDFDKYEVDFILETWTRFGSAPCLIYDDNGMFAISGDGYQPVVTGKKRIDGAVTTFVKKTQWKKTIRLALKHYINN